MSSKIFTRLVSTKDIAKRKRLEEDINATSPGKAPEQPSKKSRRNNTHSVTSTIPMGREPQLSAKKRKDAAKNVSEVVEVATSKGTKIHEGGKGKIVSFLEGAQMDPLETQKYEVASRERIEAVPTQEIGNKSEGSQAPQQEEDEIHLQGFSSESDSSDEELDLSDGLPLDVLQLPTFSKDDAVVKRKLEKAKQQPTEDKGVLYLGRIPHGFYEDQIRTYFSQFGDVTRLRLSRNKKTGRPKHYAFIEFSSSAVADIVIPKNQVHPELWVGANKKWRFVPKDRLARQKQNKPRTHEEQQRAESRLIARQKARQAKMLASGIDYDFQDVAYKPKDETEA